MKYDIGILKQLSEKLKKCPKISVGQVVLELLIKMCKISFWSKCAKYWFWSITQELLGLLIFQGCFWVPHTVCFRVLVFIFQNKCWSFLRLCEKHAQFWFEVHLPQPRLALTLLQVLLSTSALSSVFWFFFFFFSIFIALLLEAGGWREVTETSTSPLLHSQLYNSDIRA